MRGQEKLNAQVYFKYCIILAHRKPYKSNRKKYNSALSGFSRNFFDAVFKIQIQIKDEKVL